MKRRLSDLIGWLAKCCFRCANRLDPVGDYLIIGKDGTRLEFRDGLKMEGNISFINSMKGPRKITGTVTFESCEAGTQIDIADTSLDTSREP